MRKKAVASLKKNHSRTYRADQEFAKTTGVGKTAQASRGMNLFAKENIPKGYTVQKVKLKDGNYIGVVGRTPTQDRKDYARIADKKATTKSKPARGMARGKGPTIGGALPKPTRTKKNIFKKQPRSK